MNLVEAFNKFKSKKVKVFKKDGTFEIGVFSGLTMNEMLGTRIEIYREKPESVLKVREIILISEDNINYIEEYIDSPLEFLHEHKGKILSITTGNIEQVNLQAVSITCERVEFITPYVVGSVKVDKITHVEAYTWDFMGLKDLGELSDRGTFFKSSKGNIYKNPVITFNHLSNTVKIHALPMKDWECSFNLLHWYKPIVSVGEPVAKWERGI